MQFLLREIRHNPLLWLLVAVPIVLVVEKAAPEAHTVLFVLAVLAIVPLAALLSHATEAVAAKTGDAVGGLLNATLGNLTELIIAVTALHAGQYQLVKASIAGAIVTNSLFMLGASFLLGGLRYHVQEYNRAGGRLYSALLLMATVALLAPSAVADLDLAMARCSRKNSAPVSPCCSSSPMASASCSRSTPTRNFLRARNMARRRRIGRSALRLVRFSSSLCWSRL